jgi:hypothetical protein
MYFQYFVRKKFIFTSITIVLVHPQEYAVYYKMKVILGFYHSYFLRYHVYKYVDFSPLGVINMVTMATVTLTNIFLCLWYHALKTDQR